MKSVKERLIPTFKKVNWFTIFLIMFPLIFFLIEAILGRNVPDYGRLIETYLPSQFMWIWRIVKWLIITIMFFNFLFLMDPSSSIKFSIFEILILYILLPIALGYFGVNLEKGGVPLKEWCNNKIVKIINPPQCKVITEGVKPTERVKYVPISGKISIRIDTENLQSFIVNHTYVLPFSVVNEFDVPIPVQVAGLLQSGVENYRFIVNGDCGIGSDSWCTIPENSKRDFLVEFNPETTDLDVESFIECPVRLETSQNMGCDCGRDVNENIVGCSGDEKCVYVYEYCCKCLSWKKATKSKRNFFYSGAKVRFKGYFWQTKSYEIKRSTLPTARVHQILRRITGMVYRPTGWEQDNLKVSVLMFPSVYDFTLYADKKPTMIFHVKNMKRGELQVDDMAIEVGKRDFGPEVSIERCNNADLEVDETPYTVKYRIKPSVTVISKGEEIYIPCTLTIRKELIETPPHETTVHFNVFLNYTYTKSYIFDAVMIYVLTPED